MAVARVLCLGYSVGYSQHTGKPFGHFKLQDSSLFPSVHTQEPFATKSYTHIRMQYVITSVHKSLIIVHQNIFCKGGITNNDLLTILSIVKMDHIFEREGGWDPALDWSVTLRGGDQQKIA